MTAVRVLYLTGWLRTGSTLLGNVLGELPGVAHVGELHYLWRNGVLRTGTNSLCGCGDDLLDCALWARALGEVAAPAAQVVAWQRGLLRTRHTRARLAEARGAEPADGVGEVLDVMAALYRVVAGRGGGGRLVVDGSKYPAEAAALLGRRDLDVRVLHVVRDPRATALSYRRAKGYIDPRGPADSSGYWLAFNLASDLVGAAAAGRYLRIRHEDLAARPRGVVAQVMRFAGLDGEPPVDAAGRVALGGNHTVTGNPDRLARGTVTIKPDERWRAELPVPAKVVATAVAAPLLRRYGYPLIGRSPAGGRAARRGGPDRHAATGRY
ncbi:MAG TPA: sulfotransferase [Streptosporangiaceae bacterium]